MVSLICHFALLRTAPEQLSNFFFPLRIVIAAAVLDCPRAAKTALDMETRATNDNTHGKECQTGCGAVGGINRRDPATNSEQNATLILTPVHSIAKNVRKIRSS